MENKNKKNGKQKQERDGESELSSRRDAPLENVEKTRKMEERLVSLIVMTKSEKGNNFFVEINFKNKNKTFEDVDSSFSSQIIPQRFVVVRVLGDFTYFFVENFLQNRIFSTSFSDFFLAGGFNILKKTHFSNISEIERVYRKTLEVHFFRENFHKNKKDPLVKDILKNGVRLI